MKAYRHNIPYSPQEKIKALKLLEHSTIEHVCHRYHCSERTIYRWKAKYDGTIESLSNGSNKPKKAHPKAHTTDEIEHIKALLKRNPNITLNELYGKLRQNYAYTRHPVSLYRFLKKSGIITEIKKSKRYVPKKYHTPEHIGEKMQLDVKYVPYDCRTKDLPFDMNFYQYTIIDECTRERFIYAYKEQCAQSTVDFVMRAIIFFGYVPKMIQTDNGQEFTFIRETNKVHALDKLCDELGIIHKLIKPRTPRHNGKVERSHRNDNERFYKYLKFYSFEDLQKQMKAYLKRSNNIPSSAIGWKSPNEMRKIQLEKDSLLIEDNIKRAKTIKLNS